MGIYKFLYVHMCTCITTCIRTYIRVYLDAHTRILNIHIYTHILIYAHTRIFIPVLCGRMFWLRYIWAVLLSHVQPGKAEIKIANLVTMKKAPIKEGNFGSQSFDKQLWLIFEEFSRRNIQPLQLALAVVLGGQMLTYVVLKSTKLIKSLDKMV